MLRREIKEARGLQVPGDRTCNFKYRDQGSPHPSDMCEKMKMREQAILGEEKVQSLRQDHAWLFQGTGRRPVWQEPNAQGGQYWQMN